MNTFKNKLVFITGASSGIGKAIAYELATHGANLILTAPSTEPLESIASELQSTYKINVTVLYGDLIDADTPQKLYNEIKSLGLSVDVLVNNAGFGKFANFLEEDLSTYLHMTQVNINVLMSLSYLFLPEMLAKKSGGIINLSSTGALHACPYIAVYCATKAFVLSFSEALYGEYAHRGLTVLALLPGNTATNFHEVAHVNTKGMTFDSPEKVAKQAVESFLNKKSYKIVGTGAYLQSFIPRMLPRKTMVNMVSKAMNKIVNG